MSNVIGYSLAVIVFVLSQMYPVSVNASEREPFFVAPVAEPTWEDEDKHLLARTMICEAGNQSRAGQIAVADVIINRVKSDRFPDTIARVIYQLNAFECITNGVEVDYDSKQFKATVQLAEDVLAGKTPHMTEATFYHTPDVNPYWASHQDVEKLGSIGYHIFYAYK